MLHVLILAALTTVWTDNGAYETAWREYPRPQMVRDNWTCLNGMWDYALSTNTAERVEVVCAEGRIRVPFAFESSLSGVGRLITPQERMTYRRTLPLDPKPGRRILLNFEAVDYSTQVFVNGVEATDVPHEGGCLPFSVDITAFARKGDNLIEVKVWDPTEWQYGGRGKQSFDPKGCFYTRVSGIWQTVWTEEVPDEYVTGFRVETDIVEGTATFRVFGRNVNEAAADVAIFDGGREVARGRSGEAIRLPDPLKLWTPDAPNLYDYAIVYGEDTVKGYFAMREIRKIDDRNGDLRFALNGEPFHPLATLDQGWWPDGLLTPPCEEAMAFDIKTLKEYGFNTMRKHIKVEPRRYYYLCDRLGIAVFQDMPSGHEAMDLENADFNRKRYGFSRLELKGMIDHLVNEPCILMWIPYNEAWGQSAADLTRETLRWTKRYDPSRLVDGPSGWDDWEGGRHYSDWSVRPKGRFVTKRHLAPDGQTSSDVADYHQYPGPSMPSAGSFRISFLGEYGGVGAAVSNHLWDAGRKGWGYGEKGATANLGEAEGRYLGLVDKLVELVKHGLAGSVYTQTTDVELELNGLLTYDRKVRKFDASKLRAAHERVYEAARKLAVPQADYGLMKHPPRLPRRSSR